jgi:hypothetical protein
VTSADCLSEVREFDSRQGRHWACISTGECCPRTAAIRVRFPSGPLRALVAEELGARLQPASPRCNSGRVLQPISGSAHLGVGPLLQSGRAGCNPLDPDDERRFGISSPRGETATTRRPCRVQSPGSRPCPRAQIATWDSESWRGGATPPGGTNRDRRRRTRPSWRPAAAAAVPCGSAGRSRAALRLPSRRSCP